MPTGNNDDKETKAELAQKAEPAPTKRNTNNPYGPPQTPVAPSPRIMNAVRANKARAVA